MIYTGDLFDVLPTLPAESVDACVTDPPYGIGFMGKEWDTFRPGVEAERIVPNLAKESDNPNLKGRTRSPASSPSAVEYDRSLDGQRGFQVWSEQWGREVFRVLKPGGHALVCGAPRSYHRMISGLEDAGFEVRDCLSWLFSKGFPKSLDLGDGRGTALKPANEPIAVLRKPPVGTLTATVATFGTGALNIDACRTEGRWPANVALDDAMAELLDRPFFYTAKPSRAERDAGCWDLPARSGGEATDRTDGTAWLRSPRAGAGRTGGARNYHPTVKPIALMQWLVRLVTPPGGTVLDPFCGSGTTGCACVYEGRPFIGIEREAEYVAIAERRIADCLPLLQEEG